jgi:hypothetical protein
MRLKRIIAVTLVGTLALAIAARWVHAQDDAMSTSGKITFYVNKKTGQVFISPGKGRVPMTFSAGPDTQEIEQKVEQKTRDQMRAAIAETQAQQRVDNADVQKQLADIKPAWKSYMDNFQNKFRIGALSYLDYGLYSHTGFGPQFNENQNAPGVGNDGYNAFDITRVYLNTYFTPADNWTFRFTPEIYRANGAQSNASTNDKNGQTTGVGTNLDGDMNVRMKYAYVQYKGLLDNVVSQLKGANITFGAQPNPFIPWEEDLYQFRYVNLVPWNYISLSSSQVGLQVDGPVKFGGESTYAEYGFGVYNSGSFRQAEQTNTKQVMGRGTIYPFGANWRFQGLGMTGFWDYGWGNVTPDSEGLSTALKGSRAQFERIAAVLHYSAEEWNIAGEFDYGKNAFNVGNLFSASGPADAFSNPTGTGVSKAGAFGNACTTSALCYNVFNTYGPQVAVYNALLNNGRAKEEGFDAFGHYHIPGTKLTAFGMFQWFLPNVTVRGTNPLDFQRFVAGVSYQYNEYLRFALNSQNLLYYHSQESMPIASAASYNYVPGSKLNGQFLPKKATAAGTPFAYNGTIPNLVPRDIHTFFLNIEFAY